MAFRRYKMRGGYRTPGALNKATTVAKQTYSELLKTPEGRAAINYVKKKAMSTVGGVVKRTFVQNASEAIRNSLPMNLQRVTQTTPNATGTSFSSNTVGKRRNVSTRSAQYITCQYVSTSQGRVLGSTYGKQVVQQVNNITPVDDIRQAYRVGNFSGTYWRDMIIYPKQTMSNLYLTNFDNNNVVLYIYDVMSKVDTDLTVVQQLPVVGTASPSQNPSTGGETLKDPTFMGTSLLDFTAFQDFVKVLKVTRVEMEPGKSHVHTVNQYISKPFLIKNYALFTSTNNWDSNEYVRAEGFTIQQVIVAQSALIFDGTDSQVTFGTPNIGYAATNSLILKVPQSFTGLNTKYGTSFDSTVTTLKFRSQDNQNVVETTDTF